MTRNQPNILLILTDQQRLSTLRTYGDTPCLTPNLDALAGRSVVFDNAYTTCPLCTPARATIMTGLYSHQHGMTSNSGNTACAVPNLRDRPELLSRRLQGAGYDCCYTGKWHLGAPTEQLFCDMVPPALPRDVGFTGQNFPGHGGGGFRYPEYAQHLDRLGTTHKVREERKVGLGFVPYFGILEEPEEATVPYFLANHSIDQIDRCADAGAPFFLWHNFWGPHEPYYVPQAYYDLYRDVSIPEWPNYRWPAAEHEGPHRLAINPSVHELEWSDWEEAIRHYYAFMTLIDVQIGRLLKHLEARGLMDNTLILFTADHGETLGSHGGLMDKGLFHFEEIQRIPMFLSLPPNSSDSMCREDHRPTKPRALHGPTQRVAMKTGGTPASASSSREPAARIEELVSLADIYPTLLDAAGAEYDSSSLPGRSLFDLLDGCEDWREDVVIQSEGVENKNISLRTLRHGHYKYGFSLGMIEQLYDLEADPHETVNLADNDDYADVLDDLRTRLVHWMRSHGDRFLGSGVLPVLLRQGWQRGECC